jgi:4-hydroxy-2-oxoheptanedioate aldolase
MGVPSEWQSSRAFGAWCTLPDPFIAEMFATSGFDYVTVDMQHGLIGYSEMVAMLMAIHGHPAVPVVRVPSNDTATIGRVLDAGARVVIVPMIESRDQAEAAVAACRYAPDGVRSFGPPRAAAIPGSYDTAAVNARVTCLAMIETTKGVEAADEICGTPGLDGIYIGPADLAISLGIPPSGMFKSDAHRDATTTIVDACRAHGLLAAHHGVSGGHAKGLAAAGLDMITVFTDGSLLQRAAATELATARATDDAASPASPSARPY